MATNDAPDSIEASRSPLRPGDLLVGKYRVERVLGMGGMGIVFAAQHIALGELVAIKLLLPEAAQSSEAVDRFLREARAAARLRSEHITRIMDVGTLEDGSPYIVMEYLEGTDLSALLEVRPGGLPLGEAVTYVLQACEALAEAHSLGIIHRDLKPSNLFLAKRADRGTIVKVLDFGISKIMRGEDMNVTRTSTVFGSPLYMSPEQMRASRDVDVPSDIWALGIILFELLAGQMPFEAESLPQLCAKILDEPPKPLRQLRPDLSAGIETVVLKCLQKKSADRYPHIAALAEALAPFGGHRAYLSVERISMVLSTGDVPSADPSGSSLPAASSDAEVIVDIPTRRSMRWLAAGGAVGIVVVGAALAFQARSPNAPLQPGQVLASTGTVVSPAPSATAATVSATLPVATIETATAERAPKVEPAAPANRPTAKPIKAADGGTPARARTGTAPSSRPLGAPSTTNTDDGFDSRR
jgi:eukaryotic-like serine/threonine-protein kinase